MIKKAFMFFVFISVAFSLDIGTKLDTKILEKIGATKEIVVIDFFASWCVSCKKELPLIDKLSKNMQNIDFIGVDSDENKEDGLAFQKELNLDFHIYNDNNQNIIKQFDPIGVPAVYILKNGVVKKMRFGALDDIDKIIKKDISELK